MIRRTGTWYLVSDLGHAANAAAHLFIMRAHLASSRYHTGRQQRWFVPGACYDMIFFFFLHTFTFQLLDKPWSQVSSLLPGSCLQFLSRIGFSYSTARRLFIECCLLTLSRFPQVNLSTRKSPNEFIRVCTRRGSNSRS